MVQYLMEFNSSPGDLMELSPLFSDDSRVAEAASIAQKLRKTTLCSLKAAIILYFHEQTHCLSDRTFE